MLAAERIHGDDTTVPVLAKRQDHHRPIMDLCARRPAVRRAGPAGGDLLLLAQPRRRASARHLAGYAGILQADAYAGFGDLYDGKRTTGADHRGGVLGSRPAQVLRAGRLPQAPLALEAVRRIDAIFDDRARDQRSARPATASPCARTRIAPLVADLENWMRAERARLSRHAEIAKAMDYMLKRWLAFTRFLDDGRICLSNNAAERALRGIALGRSAWLFAGSDRGGERAAAMYTLIATAKLNDIDPAGLARRRPAPHRRSSGLPPRRAPALALGKARRSSRRCLTLPHRGLRNSYKKVTGCGLNWLVSTFASPAGQLVPMVVCGVFFAPFWFVRPLRRR